MTRQGEHTRYRSPSMHARVAIRHYEDEIRRAQGRGADHEVALLESRLQIRRAVLAELLATTQPQGRSDTASEPTGARNRGPAY